jgi:hypothetical protein
MKYYVIGFGIGLSSCFLFALVMLFIRAYFPYRPFSEMREFRRDRHVARLERKRRRNFEKFKNEIMKK